MSDLVGNPEELFSHNEALIIYVGSRWSQQKSKLRPKPNRMNGLNLFSGGGGLIESDAASIDVQLKRAAKLSTVFGLIT